MDTGLPWYPENVPFIMNLPLIINAHLNVTVADLLVGGAHQAHDSPIFGQFLIFLM